MIAALWSFKKNITKFLWISLLVFPIIFYLNTGFLLDSYWKIAQAFIFTIVFTAIFIWPQFKKYIFWTILIAFLLTIFLYVVNLIEVADIIGSSGFGLIIINLISYLPQLIKLGYIKKL